MNKFKTIIASCLIALSVGSISTAIVQSVNATEVKAAIPSGYYNSVTDSMEGETLRSKLNSIINNSGVSVSYDWSRYETADEDPNNSSNILTVYARTSMPKSSKDPGSSGYYWNREHTFPQSSMSVTQAKSDNHIIYASDKKVNGIRSNIKMGQVTGGTVITDGAGNTTTCRYTSSLFDPNNRARGIVARTTMYAAAMYNFTPTENFESIYRMLEWHLNYPVDTFDINRNDKVYNLQHNRNPFVDHPEYACRIWGSTNQQTQALCNSSTDPVAVTGISLDKASASIDAGSSTTITATISPSDATDKTVKWTSSNTSVATVSSATSQSGTAITINGVSAGSATITATSNEDSSIKKTCTVTVNAVTPAVTSVTLNKSTLSLAAGKSETLTATVVTVGGAAQTVNWESSNTDVATVTSSGVVTVKSNATVGQTATITATSTVDSNQKDSCLLTVKDSSSTSTYTIGWGTATGTAGTYSNFTATSGSVANIVSFASDKNSAGSAPAYNASSSELRLYYHSSGDGGSITLTPASGITITKVVIKTSTSPSVKYTVDGGSATSISASNNTYTISGISASSSLYIQNANTTNTQLRIKTIEITYEESSTPTPTKTLSSIDISGYETSFTVGDTFSFGGTVTANYSDGTDANVTTSASFSGYDMSSAGNQTVTVSYTEGGVTKEKTYNITVSAAPTPTTDGAYKLVSDASKLRVGDKVIIVNTDGTGALSTTQNSNNRASTSVSKNSDGTISISDSVQSLELKAGTTSGTFSFYTGSGYLYAASSSKNYLRTETSLSANSSFTIAIAENIATVTAQGTNTNKIMRYNANNGNPIFSCYSSADNTISIYKKLYTAVEYSRVFLDEVGCDASGATAPSQDNWSLLKYRFNNEAGSDAKSALSNATAHEYKNPSTDEQYLAQAMYQYDYIMGKYNKTSVVYEKFITGRASNGLIFNGNIYASNMNDNIVPILVIIGILSLTGAGIILFVRKRKEI